MSDPTAPYGSSAKRYLVLGGLIAAFLYLLVILLLALASTN